MHEEQQLLRIAIPRPPIHEHVKESDERQKNKHRFRFRPDCAMKEIVAIVAHRRLAGSLEPRVPARIFVGGYEVEVVAVLETSSPCGRPAGRDVRPTAALRSLVKLP